MTNPLQAFYTRLFRQNEFAIKLGLDNIRSALKAHGSKHLDHRRVLVAGTNGKGEAAATLAGLLTLNGHRTGLFTSPHLIDFSERFRINGAPIDEHTMLEVGPRLFRDFGEASPRHPSPLTFFELATLMGVEIFSRSACDFVVYEVGLGGRLDATNALDPELSIITSIGLDHQKWLGDSLSAIAREKAGVMRPGRPVIISSMSAQETLLEEAHRSGARAYLLGRDFDISAPPVTYRGGGLSLRLPFLDNAPAFKRANVSGAITAFRLMCPAKTQAWVNDALSRIRWPGRLWPLGPNAGRELLPASKASILLDAAHNPDGFSALVNTLKDRTTADRVHFVYGAMADKDLKSIGERLRDYSPASISLVPINSTRALDAQELARRLSIPKATLHESLREGLRRALAAAGSEGMVVIAGSIYLLGEALALLGNERDARATLA